MKTKTLVAPLIHLNGTQQDDLVDSLDAAHVALGAALDALRHCAPNGRDYYVQAVGAFESAVDQHRARSMAVANAQAEVEAIIGSILDDTTTAVAQVRD